VRTQEPEQLGEKRVVVERRAQTPLLQFAYKTPAVSDAKAPAISLLKSILTDSDASRLHRLLVEEQKIAIEVSGYWHEGFDPGLLHLFIALPQGGDVQKVERVLDAELQRLVQQGVTSAELRRAKNLAAAGFWRGLATIDGKAQLLGEFEVMQGDWRRLFTASTELEKVTAAEVQAVAAQILQSRQRTVGVLLPKATEG
jgi:zinc protease